MLKSLRIRLTLIFISLAVGPVLLVGIILSQRSFTVEQEQAVDLQRQVAQRVSAEVDGFLGEVENNLFLLGGEIRNLDQPDRAQKLSLLLNALSSGTFRDDYQQMSLLDAQGKEEVRVSRQEIVSTADLVDRSSADVFIQPKTTHETYFSPVQLDKTTGEPFITIAIPLYQLRSVELSGVLIADFRVGAIRSLIDGLQLNKDQTVYMIDSANKVVVYDDPSVVTKGTTFALPSADGRTQGLLGTEVLFASDGVQTGNLDLKVVAERPVSVALELAQNGLSVSIVITALALIGAVGLVILIVRQVVLPIEKLSGVARSIQGGDLSARAIVTNQDEIGILARSFNDMTSRLQNMIESLEDRVSERVRDLTLASEASRQIATELDSARLLSDVAKLTVSTFKLYHVSIFLYDQDSQTLTLRQGTGEIGEKMVSQGKAFRIGDSGLVPLASRSRKATVSNNVRGDISYLPNPLLPETRSELAVPMLYRGQLLGILDLQSKDANRFRDEDIQIMTTLAEQIAIAVRNAQLFEEVQSALQDAERANSVKSAFLASMSHELRTPLNAVINFTRFVIDGDTGPINAQQTDLLSEVVNSAKHLLNLINDVLDMSKIEAGSLNLFIEDNISLNEILKNAESTGRILLTNKPVRFYTSIDEQLPVVRGDRQRILQIMLNIISNACKFTEEGEIRVNAHQVKDEIVISVSDTGPGIAAKDQAIVFEAFKQTDTGLRQQGGTGLGMPIARSLAEAHGGRLWLESEPGKGTTFYVALPLNSEVLMALMASQ